MTESLPCYSCADEAAGKPKCERWCTLPGKCPSNMAPPTGGFCTFEFWEREAPGHITPLHDFNAMKALLEASGVQALANGHNYQISISRSDLPRLVGRLERILRVISPYVDWSKPNSTHGVLGNVKGGE